MTPNLDRNGSVLYEGHCYQIIEAREFANWLELLRDRRAVAKIIDRLKRAANGNFGDVESVGGGVCELRLNYGPGYRVYFTQRGKELILLLCGGDKSSQKADIVRAKQLKIDIERRDGNQTV